MAGLRTEFPFVLPKGLLEDDGTLHREGTMRLATARDELDPLADPKVRDADDPYLTIIVLSRVITRLGGRSRLTPRDVESLFAADLAYLQDFYSTINYGTDAEVEQLVSPQRGRRPTALPEPPAEPETAPAPRAAGPASAADPDTAEVAQDGDEPDDVDEPAEADAEVIEKPSASGRRARIEEVGRSSARPKTGTG